MRKLVSLLGASMILIGTQANAQETPPAAPAEGAAAADAEKPAGEQAVEKTESAAGGVKTESQSVASEAGLKGAEGGQFGPAGCGLGSMLFEPDSGLTQIFAATTNGTSGTQTFGISSGTSNCDGTGVGPASAKNFVETNRAALAKDIARGRGETIRGLTTLAGCQDARSVGKKLQRNFKVIFPNAKVSDRQVSASVLRVLKRESALACSNLDA